MTSGPISINAPRSVPPPPTLAVTTINPEASETQDKSALPRTVNTSEKVENPSSDQSREQSSQKPNLTTLELEPAEQRVLEQLKARDREVRAHEQAHLSAAGNLATGGASFSYQKGPDGQRYAIGGEVGITSAKVPGDPEATIKRAQQIRRAALAPASPSAQDRSVAARATATEQKAQVELTKQLQEERGQSAVAAFNSIQINSETENPREETKPASTTAPIDTFA